MKSIHKDDLSAILHDVLSFFLFALRVQHRYQGRFEPGTATRVQCTTNDAVHVDYIELFFESLQCIVDIFFCTKTRIRGAVYDEPC